MSRMFPLSAIAKTLASIKKSPELLQAEKGLEAARADRARLLAEAGPLRNQLAGIGPRGAFFDEAGTEKKVRELDAKIVQAEAMIVACRRARAGHLPKYGAELDAALAEPVGEAAQKLLDTLPEIRAALATLNDAAQLLAATYTRETGGTNGPMTARLMGINLSALQQLEQLATDLRAANPPALIKQAAE